MAVTWRFAPDVEHLRDAVQRELLIAIGHRAAQGEWSVEVRRDRRALLVGPHDMAAEIVVAEASQEVLATAFRCPPSTTWHDTVLGHTDRSAELAAVVKDLAGRVRAALEERAATATTEGLPPPWFSQPTIAAEVRLTGQGRRWEGIYLVRRPIKDLRWQGPVAFGSWLFFSFFTAACLFVARLTEQWLFAIVSLVGLPWVILPLAQLRRRLVRRLPGQWRYPRATVLLRLAMLLGTASIASWSMTSALSSQVEAEWFAC